MDTEEIVEIVTAEHKDLDSQSRKTGSFGFRTARKEWRY
jgi:hypothetical protein